MTRKQIDRAIAQSLPYWYSCATDDCDICVYDAGDLFFPAGLSEEGFALLAASDVLPDMPPAGFYCASCFDMGPAEGCEQGLTLADFLNTHCDNDLPAHLPNKGPFYSCAGYDYNYEGERAFLAGELYQPGKMKDSDYPDRANLDSHKFYCANWLEDNKYERGKSLEEVLK